MLGRIACRPCGTAAALVAGLAVGALAPQTPMHAVATNSSERFALATGALDETTEAVYYLDFASGELRAAVLSSLTRRFNAFFHANVAADLRVDSAKNPKYLLVTGTTYFRPNAGFMQPGNSVIYVAELTTGQLAAYNVPWSQNFANSGTAIRKPMHRLDVISITPPAVAAK